MESEELSASVTPPPSGSQTTNSPPSGGTTAVAVSRNAKRQLSKGRAKGPKGPKQWTASAATAVTEKPDKEVAPSNSPGDAPKKFKRPCTVYEPAFRSNEGSPSHFLCLHKGWAWELGQGDNAHEIGALARHRLRYMMAREISDHINDECQKNPKVKMHFCVAVMFPGKDMVALSKLLVLDPKRASISFYGVRPALYIGDAARDRKPYAPIPDGVKLDFVVALDCLHFLSGPELWSLMGPNCNGTTVFLANLRPIQCESPGFYNESYPVYQYEKIAEESEENEEPKPAEWTCTNQQVDHQGGFGFIDGNPPTLHYAASILDNAYAQPLGDQWLNTRLPVGERRCCFETHVHRSILNQILIRMKFLRNVDETDVARTAPLPNSFVLVSNGVCRGALEATMIRAARTVRESVTSVDNLAIAARVAVDRVMPAFLWDVPQGSRFRSLVTRRTAEEALLLVDLGTPYVPQRLGVHPAVEYAELRYAALGKPLAAAAARVAQPARNRVEGASQVAEGLLAAWVQVKEWWNSDPRYLEVEAELSVARATWVYAKTAIQVTRAGRRWFNRAESLLGWTLNRLHWTEAASKLHAWAQKHPRFGTAGFVLWCAANAVSTAITEETFKRLNPLLRARLVLSLAVGLYEAGAWLLTGSSWEDELARVLAHAVLGLLPWTAAVCLHAAWDFILRLKAGPPAGATTARGYMLEDYLGDLRDTMDQGQPEVGQPIRQAMENMPEHRTESKVIRGAHVLDHGELDRLNEELNATLAEAGGPDPGRAVAFPNDCNWALARPSNHPLILLEIDEQRLDVPLKYEAQEDAVLEARDELIQAMRREDMTFTPLSDEEFLDAVWESEHPVDWKLRVSAWFLQSDWSLSKGSSKFAKTDELLIIRYKLGASEAEAWRGYCKTRPINPMDESQVIDFLWTKPMKKSLGSKSLFFPLTPAGYRGPKQYLRFQFLEAPNDVAITEQLETVTQYAATVLDHGDDSLLVYADWAARQYDLVSADRSECADVQRAIVDCAKTMTSHDPLVDELTDRHYKDLSRGFRSGGAALKEQDVKIVRKGKVETITGEPATALKNGMTLAMKYGLACRRYRETGPEWAVDQGPVVVDFLGRRHLTPSGAGFQEAFGRCIGQAAREMGLDAAQGPGTHISEMTFLGGGFADTAGCGYSVADRSDYAWVSLAVIKCQFYPTGVFTGSCEHQARQWSYICSLSVGGCPAAQTFTSIGKTLPFEDLVEAMRLDSERLQTRWRHRHRHTNTYQVTFEAWADMLKALCRSCGCPMDDEVQELVDEFEEKALVANPSLEFTASWQPLYVARFGKLPATAAECEQGGTNA